MQEAYPVTCDFIKSTNINKSGNHQGKEEIVRLACCIMVLFSISWLYYVVNNIRNYK